MNLVQDFVDRAYAGELSERERFSVISAQASSLALLPADDIDGKIHRLRIIHALCANEPIPRKWIET